MILWMFVDMMLFKPSNSSDEAVALSLRASFQLIVCEASLISLLFVTYSSSSWLNILLVNCNVVFLSVIKWQGTYIFLPLPRIRCKRRNQTISLWSTSLTCLSHTPDSQKFVLQRINVDPPWSHQRWVIFLTKKKEKSLFSMLVLSPLAKKIVQLCFRFLQQTLAFLPLGNFSRWVWSI